MIVAVAGAGMTEMGRLDQSVDALAVAASRAALADAGIEPRDIATVLVANALGGQLSDQGCVRGQAWLRSLDFGGTPIVNVENACASAASALWLGVRAVEAGESPVLVVGVEKMWEGTRVDRIAAIDGCLSAHERRALQAAADGPSTFMSLNATWCAHQLGERGTTLEQIAATAVKAFTHAARNPRAPRRTSVDIRDVLASDPVAGPLTRLMCSSFTDGAAAVVLSAASTPSAPRIRTSVLRSGNSTHEYHDRMAHAASDTWKVAGLGPEDLDIVELHDATSAEELYACEALGLYGPGEAGVATVRGETSVGGVGTIINPSGGLVGRGHPIGATGLCQVVEAAEQLTGRAGDRQVSSPSLALCVNTGGIIAGDVCSIGLTVLEAGPGMRARRRTL